MGRKTAVFASMCVAAATIVSGNALAASPNFNWSGWYVGGTAGFGWRNLNAYPPGSYYTSLGADFTAGTAYGGTSGGGETRHTGFNGSVLLGYSYQLPQQIVIGAEYEFLYADLANKPSLGTTSFRKGSGPFATAYTVGNYDTADGDSNRWYGVARARVGIPFERGLFYVTGGAAYRFSYATSDPVVTTYTYSFPPPTTTASTTTYGGYNKSNTWGWVAGFGVEYAVSDNLFLRSEFLHMDFGNASYLDPVATALTGAPSVLNFRRASDIVRVGLSYRFYGGPSAYGTPATY